MMDLATMRANVARDLDDAAGAIWSNDELDRAIGRALSDYSAACPRRADTVIELTQDGREIDVSGVAGMMGIERVWHPYETSESTWPRRWPAFEHHPGGKLVLLAEPAPAAGESVRVFYWGAHTLDGLDGASATTLPAADEEIVALGAAGYAALEKARGAVGAINVSGYTPLHWADWAARRLAEFARRLDQARERWAGAESGPMGMA